MKLSTSFSIALLSTFASVSNVLGSTYDPNVPDPVCIKLDNINFKSVNAEFVNTDGSPGNQITTGDMSIAEQYVGNGNMPVNQPPFYGISTGFKSICVTTRDQGLPMVSGYSPSSPTCFYEFDLRFCRKWKWIYFPGWYTSTPVLNDEFVESSTNLRAGARPSYEDSTTIKETDVTDVFEPVIKKIPLNEVIGVDKIVQAVIEVTGNKSFQAGPTPTDADGLVDAIQIDDVFAQYNQKYTQILCPQKFCWIPFYAECRKGGYTAHGSGPENLKITGGSYDFYGGFGQIVTPTPFSIGGVDPFTLDIQDTSIDMELELCYYRRYNGGFF
jgi:hypothetical protein